MKKKIRLLKDIKLDHIALTSKGAASLVDEPFLLKALHVDESNTAGTVEGNTGKTMSVDADVNKNLDDEDTMSQDVIKALQDELAVLKKERDFEKSKSAFAKYDLPETEVEALANAFQGDVVETITKAFDILLDKNAQVAVVVEEAGLGGEPEPVVEVTKSVKQQAEEYLKKSMENK